MLGFGLGLELELDSKELESVIEPGSRPGLVLELCEPGPGPEFGLGFELDNLPVLAPVPGLVRVIRRRTYSGIVGASAAACSRRSFSFSSHFCWNGCCSCISSDEALHFDEFSE